jgi:hypothetical protein
MVEPTAAQSSSRGTISGNPSNNGEPGGSHVVSASPTSADAQRSGTEKERLPGILSLVARINPFKRKDEDSASSTSADGQRFKELLPGISSLTALINAYKEKDDNDQAKAKWRQTQKDFVEVNGDIVDSYFPTNLHAGAVLVRRKDRSRLPWRERRRLLVRLDRKDILSREQKFEEVIWRTLWTARRTERESDFLLTHRTRKVFADMLHQVAVYLLGTVDALAMKPENGRRLPNEGLKRAADAATKELDQLEEYVERAAIRAAIRLYLLGLPLGAAFLSVIVFFVQRFDSTNPTVRMYGISTVVAGGIGSMASVMFRLTRGQRLSVDIQQGPVVTVFAGMFRPLIGAVFGVALYVLVRGGLLPLEVPSGFPDHFYAGLAFIAGFSERWAQDTIVRSTPIAPSPVAPASRAGANHDGTSLDENSTQGKRPRRSFNGKRTGVVSD